MALYETKAIVLKAYNLAEADRIVVFLTKEHGAVRGVAKGAKRLKSRFGSGLEAFSIVRLSYFQKDALELVSIRDVELEKSYFAAAAEPAFLQKFSYLADLLLAMTPPHDPNEMLYRMVAACLDAAEAAPETLDRVGLYFELWALRLGGYLPDWSRCDDCTMPFSSTAEANLQMNFHLICEDCKRARSEWVISGAERDIFAAAQKLSPASFSEYCLSMPDEVADISRVMRRIISQVVGREVTEERTLAVTP